MSREIKFRARATCSDKWAYGSYVECDGGYYIVVKLGGDGVAKIQIHPETVGQYTGLKDKNGLTDIYEGDIIRDVSVSSGGYTKWWDGIVTWHDAGSVGWVAEPLSENKHRGAWGLNYNYEYEIIGNIHQNPELMEQGNGK